MKFTKTLVAAALLAGASGAQASVQLSTDAFKGGSEFILTLWDQAGAKSYTLDLGLTVAAFKADVTAPHSWTISSSADANFASVLSNADFAGLQYSVVGGQQKASSAAEYPAVGYGLYTTLNSQNTQADLQGRYGTANMTNLNGSLQKLATYLGVVNTAQGGVVDVAQNLSDFQTSDKPAYAGKNWSGNIGGSMGGVASNLDLVGTAMHFEYVGGSTASKPVYTEYDNVWNFTLNTVGGVTTGTLTYDAIPAAVPLPATAWMFLSGVMGLLSFKRRKSAV